MARPQRLGLSFLVVLAFAGCASLPGAGPSNDAEIQRLRERVAQLEREARVREVELRRLRAAAGVATGPSARPPTPPPVSAPPPSVVLEEDLAPPMPETEIEEADLDLEPIGGPTAPPPSPASTPAPTSAPAPPTSSDAQALYDDAYSLFHQQRYEEAESRFEEYLRLHPSTRLADNAQFWIGECRYARDDPEGALEAFLRTVEAFPEGNKVPDAMVKAGKCLEALGDTSEARATYEEVRRARPGTAAAAIAEERLLMLR